MLPIRSDSSQGCGSGSGTDPWLSDGARDEVYICCLLTFPAILIFFGMLVSVRWTPGLVREACLGVQEAYIDDKDEDMSAVKAAGRIGYAMLAEWIWFVVGAVVGFGSMALYDRVVPWRFKSSSDNFLRIPESLFVCLYVGALVSGLVAGYVLLNNVIIGEHSKFESRLIICGATNVIMVFVFMGVAFAVRLARPRPEPTHTPTTPLISDSTRNGIRNGISNISLPPLIRM